MELINKGQEVVFSGGVKMTQSTDVLTAREMRTTQNRDRITASGDVRLFRQASSTETWRGSGEKGFYDANAGLGTLWGGKDPAYINKTEVVSSTISRGVDMWGDQIDFFRESKMAKAVGRARGKTIDPETGDQYEFWSDKAVYDGKAKVLVLNSEKLSRILQTGKATKREVFGHAITYYVDSDRMVSDGEAQAVMVDDPSAHSAKPNK
jgi:lipopolysaccharide export system protein LptA